MRLDRQQRDAAGARGRLGGLAEEVAAAGSEAGVGLGAARVADVEDEVHAALGSGNVVLVVLAGGVAEEGDHVGDVGLAELDLRNDDVAHLLPDLRLDG